MMRMRKKRMRRLQPRKPTVEAVHQAKPRRQLCTRRTVKKTRTEAIQSLRWSRMKARTTLIQRLQQRRRRLRQRRSQQKEGRRDEAGRQDQLLPKRKSQAQSTTSMTSPTPPLSLRKALTIPVTQTTDLTLLILG